MFIATQYLRQTIESAERLGPPPEGKSGTWRYMNNRVMVTLGHTVGEPDLYLVAEWYVPESYGSDDESYMATALPPRHGMIRRAYEIRGATLDDLMDAIDHA